MSGGRERKQRATQQEFLFCRLPAKWPTITTKSNGFNRLSANLRPFASTFANLSLLSFVISKINSNRKTKTKNEFFPNSFYCKRGKFNFLGKCFGLPRWGVMSVFQRRPIHRWLCSSSQQTQLPLTQFLIYIPSVFFSMLPPLPTAYNSCVSHRLIIHRVSVTRSSSSLRLFTSLLCLG